MKQLPCEAGEGGGAGHGEGLQGGEGDGEVGWKSCSRSLALLKPGALTASSSEHAQVLTQRLENFWILLPEKVWKQTVPQADKFMDNRFIQI